MFLFLFFVYSPAEYTQYKNTHQWSRKQKKNKNNYSLLSFSPIFFSIHKQKTSTQNKHTHTQHSLTTTHTCRPNRQTLRRLHSRIKWSYWRIRLLPTRARSTWKIPQQYWQWESISSHIDSISEGCHCQYQFPTTTTTISYSN